MDLFGCKAAKRRLEAVEAHNRKLIEIIQNIALPAIVDGAYQRGRAEEFLAEIKRREHGND